MEQHTNRSPNAVPPACPICRGIRPQVRSDWHYICTTCGFEYSSLLPQIETRTVGLINEVRRQKALEQLRRKNAEQVLDALAGLRRLVPGSLLDVGSAYGWFLRVAQERGMEVLGIEPEHAIAAAARASGLTVRDGFFPSAVHPNERFDVICFNDVLEHIPNPERIMLASAERLKPGGLLSVVIPLQTGIFYRTANWLARFGINGPLDRMWQKSFHSPHLSYFRQAHLEELARRAGLQPVLFRTLESVARHGLWERIRYNRASNTAISAIYWLALAPSVPVVNHLPADIGHFVFRREGA